MPTMVVLSYTAPYIIFDAASGPVDHYEVRTRTIEGDTILYASPDASTTVELPSVPESTYFVDLRAVAADGKMGPWSPVHNSIGSDNSNTTADLDHNGGVGVSDYNLLSSHWGEPGYGVGLFNQLSTDWGRLTMWDDRLGLRRYVQ
jgi:hypothetical protein